MLASKNRFDLKTVSRTIACLSNSIHPLGTFKDNKGPLELRGEWSENLLYF